MSLAWVWGVSGTLFAVGFVCLVARRQLLAMILGVELMVNAANLNIVCHAAMRGDAAGLAVALLVIAAAAAEAVVGLALLVALGREGAFETPELRDLSG